MHSTADRNLDDISYYFMYEFTHNLTELKEALVLTSEYDVQEKKQLNSN